MSKDSNTQHRATRQRPPTKISWKGTIQAMKKWKRYSSGSKNDGSRSFHCQCHASHCRIYICKRESGLVSLLYICFKLNVLLPCRHLKVCKRFVQKVVKRFHNSKQFCCFCRKCFCMVQFFIFDWIFQIPAFKF